MLEGRPLYDTAADRDLFVPHAAWNQVRAAAERGFNVLLSAPRGAGKTSMLRQLQLALRDAQPDRSPVFVDAAGAHTPLELVEHVREAMRGRPSSLRTLAEQAAFSASLLTREPAGAASTYLVRLVRELGDEPPHTVLLDASGAGAAVYQLFGRLRDELWQLDHRWVVALDVDELGAVRRPPADAFFDVEVSLAGVSAEELEELLRRRQTPLGDESLREIAEASRGNPRAAIRTARQAVIEERAPREVLAEQAWRQTEAGRLGRPHAMLMAELEHLGAASASDEELLDRTGWTRERAAQVLAELERAGLATASTERRARGRPRKIFRPAERPA